MTTTKTIPADELTIGTWFIPAGKKFPVEILMIDDLPGELVIGCYRQGFTVNRVSRYSTVEAVIPERVHA